MKFHLQALILFFLVPQSLIALETCQDLPKEAHARMAVTATGMPKITKRILDETLPKIAADLKNKNFGNIKFSCKIPKILYSSNSWKEIFSLDNSVCEIENLSLQNLETLQTNVTCAATECEITIPIPALRFRGDIKISSPQRKETAVAVKGLVVGFEGEGNKVSSIKFKAALTPQGSLEKLVQIESGTEKTDVMPSSLIFDLDFPEDRRERFKRSMISNIYRDMQKEFKLPDLEDEEKMAKVLEIVQKMDPSKPDKNVKEKKIEKIVTDNVVYLMREYFGFNNEKAFGIYTMLSSTVHRVRDLALDEPVLKNALNNVLGKTLLPHLTKIVNPQLENLPIVHRPETYPIPLLSPQDNVDEEKQQKVILSAVDKITALQQQQTAASEVVSVEDLSDYLKDGLKMFSDVRDTRKLNWLRGVNFLISEYRRAFVDKMQTLLKGKTPREEERLLNRYKEQDELLADLQKNILGKIETGKSHIIEAQELASIQFASTKAAELPHMLEVYLTACVECSKIQPIPLNPADQIKFENNKPYDLAFQASLDNFNQYMKMLFDKKYLKMCINDKKEETCSNSSLKAGRTWFAAHEPPRIAL